MEFVFDNEDDLARAMQLMAERCQDCFWWKPVRWSKKRVTWGRCKQTGLRSKWTCPACDDFRRKPSRAVLWVVK